MYQLDTTQLGPEFAIALRFTETTGIEVAAVINRMIAFSESCCLAGFRGAIETGRAVAVIGKEFACDHAADDRTGDAAQQAARHKSTQAHTARLTEHALHRARLPDFRARCHAR
jgi:hypothetical protein